MHTTGEISLHEMQRSATQEMIIRPEALLRTNWLGFMLFKYDDRSA